MKFQTPVPVKRQSPEIGYHSNLVLMGSCFVEHIGSKLAYYNFPSLTNRFGVIFNPYSIANLLERAVNGKLFTEGDLFFANERWHCFEVHSVCSMPHKGVMLESLNRGLAQLRESLEAASHVVITLGTAWVYRHLETNRVVANCHKVPQKAFAKELLDIQEIKLQLERTDHLIRSLNPDCTAIATVSPVRHLKDGVVENQRSKSHLIAALHEFMEEVEHWKYFPSFEILMDELRDYRFYADDMLHPSQVAVEVVWDRFVKSWVKDDALPVMKRVERIRKGLQHKPFDPEAEAHRVFLEKLDTEINELTGQYPFMRF